MMAGAEQEISAPARHGGAEARPVVGMLGLGEAGSSIGADLVRQGVTVKAWDPDPERSVAGVEIEQSSPDAVAGSDFVLSINSSSAAVAAARAAASTLRESQVFADLNSGSRDLKREVAAVIAPTGALFVDAALMDGVPGRGLGTRCLVSGPGAAAFVEAFLPLGMPVEAIGTEPGDAATHKLLRSIFAKGLAAVTQEAVRAGAAVGCEEWVREEIGRMLSSADERLVERFLVGSQRHAARRAREMEDVRDLMLEIGVTPRVTLAALAYLSEMAEADGTA